MKIFLSLRHRPERVRISHLCCATDVPPSVDVFGLINLIVFDE